MALDRLQLETLDDGRLAPFEPSPLSAAQPAGPEPIPVSTAPTTVEPIPPAPPAPVEEPMSWEQIWASMPGSKPPEAVASALRPQAASGVPAAMPTGEATDSSDLRAVARAAAAKYGVDPDIYEAQIQQESGFNPNAVNPNSGAAGIAQFMPATAAGFGIDPMDPIAALDAGAKYMAQNLQANGGDYVRALAAYNWGPGNVSTWDGNTATLPAETQHYVQTIMGAPRQAPGAFTLPGAPQAAAPGLQDSDLYPLQDPSVVADADVWSLCGPIAAIAFARMTGRNPTVAEAKALAQQLGLWDADNGMHGPDAEVQLLQAMGVAAKWDAADAAAMADDIRRGNPVIVNGTGHYFVAQNARQRQDGSIEFDFGNSARALAASQGRTWYTLEELSSLSSANLPIAVRGAIYLDSPTSVAPSVVAGRNPDYRPVQPSNPQDPNVDSGGIGKTKSLLERINEMTEYTRQLAAEASGSARDLADRAATGAAPYLDNLGRTYQYGANRLTDPSRWFNLDTKPIQQAYDLLMSPVTKANEETLRQRKAEVEQYARENGITTDQVNRVRRERGLPIIPYGPDGLERPDVPQVRVNPNLPTGQALQGARERGYANTWIGLLEGAADLLHGVGATAAGDWYVDRANYYRQFLIDSPNAGQKSTQDALSSPFGVVEGVVEGLPSVLPTVAAALMALNPATRPLAGPMAQVGMGTGVLSSYGSTLSEYREKIERGEMTPEAVRLIAAGSGAMEYLTEKLMPGADKRLLTEGAKGFQRYLQRELAQRGLLGIGKDFVKEIGQEAFEEMLSEVYGVATDAYFKSEEGMTWLGALRRIANAGVIGAASAVGPGAIQSGAQVAALPGARQAAQEAPGAPQPAPVGQQSTPAPAALTEAPVAQNDLLDTLARGVEPVARDHQPESPGDAAAIGQTLPFPAHRIGETTTIGELPTEGALALQPQRSNMIAEAPVRPFEEVEAAFDRGERPSQQEIAQYYLTTFHGTGRAFDRYDPDRDSGENLYGKGLYLTSDPRVAASYALARSEIDNPDYGTEGADLLSPSDIENNPYKGRDREDLRREIDRAYDALVENDYRGGEDHHATAMEISRDIALIEAAMHGAKLPDGPNVRAVYVPKDLNLFNVEREVPSAEAARIYDVARRVAPEVANRMARMRDDMGWRERAFKKTGISGQDLYDTLKSIYRNSANEILAAAGYDGVYYGGGRRIPMQDDDGNDINHHAMVVFPESVDKVRNGFAGTRGGMAATHPSGLLADVTINGYRLVGGPMRGGNETSDLIAGEAQIPGTTALVLGQAGEHDQPFLDAIANQPYMPALVPVLEKVHNRILTHLARLTTATPGQKPSQFINFVLGPNLLGDNAQSDRRDTNQVGVNVHEIFHQSALDARTAGVPIGSDEFFVIFAEHLIGSTSEADREGTVAHEVAHNKYRDHGNEHAALTTLLSEAAGVGEYAQILARDLKRAFGDNGLQALHADYVAIRERAQRGAATPPVTHAGPTEELPAHGTSSDPDSGQQRQPGVGPNISAPTRGPGVRPGADLGNSPTATPQRTEPEGADGLGPVRRPDAEANGDLDLDPVRTSELLNDFHDSASKLSESDQLAARSFLRELRTILTPENVEQAIEIAAPDATKTDGGRFDSIDDAKQALRADLQRALPELFGGRPAGEPKYEHASAQLDLPQDLAERIVNIVKRHVFAGTSKKRGAKAKREPDLDGDGYELEPHITIRYGFGEESVGAVLEALEQHGPITVSLGQVNYFAGQDGQPDVVYLEVGGEDIHSLNRAVQGIEAPGETHPEYTPHVTLAYVKNGKGAEVAARLNKEASFRALNGREISFETAQVSDLDGQKEKATLGASVAPPAPKDEDEESPPAPPTGQLTNEVDQNTSSPPPAPPEATSGDFQPPAPPAPPVAEENPEPEPEELPDRGMGPQGYGGLNLDRVPPAFRKILERKLAAMAKADKQYPRGVGDIEVRRAAEAAGYDPNDPEYEANVEKLAQEIIGRDTAGRAIEIEALKRAIIESMLEQFDGLASLNQRMSEEGATPELLEESEAHVQRIIDQQELGLLALRRAGEESGRALRRMQMGLADAAEMEKLQRYRMLQKAIDPVRQAVAAKVKAIAEGKTGPGGPETSILVRQLQRLEKLGALSDFRIKTAEGNYLPLSTLSDEQMQHMSRADVMRAMSAASRAWYEELRREAQAAGGENRSAMAAGAPNEASLAYRLGENARQEQRAHNNPAAREKLAAEREEMIARFIEETLEADDALKQEEGMKGGTAEERMDSVQIRILVNEAIGRRAEARARAEALAESRQGEAIGPGAEQIRDYRNAENMTMAAEVAAASSMGRVLAHLEQRLKPGESSGVVDLLRAKFDAAVHDLSLHAESEGHVEQVRAAYERAADGEGQRLVSSALRVLTGEKYIGNNRVVPSEVAALNDPKNRRLIQQGVSAVLEKPDDDDARELLGKMLDTMRAKYGAAGERLADDLTTLIAMEDARRIANGTIDAARADPTNADKITRARDAIEQVRALANAEQQPWLYQRFAPIPYTLEERLDVAVERALENLAGKEARALLKTIIADPGNLDAKRDLAAAIQRTDPATARALQEMLGVHLNPEIRGAAAQARRQGATETQQQSAADRLIARLEEFDRIGRGAVDPETVQPMVDEIYSLLDGLGEYGQQRAEQQRKKMRGAELSRLRLRNADVSQEQWKAFMQIAAEGDPAATGRALRLIQNPTFAQYVKEWGIIAMLSSPTTWSPIFGSNQIGNVLNAGFMGVKWLPELGYDMAASALTGREREMFASEAAPALKALRQNLQPGLQEAWDIWWKGGGNEIDRALDRTVDNAEIRNLRTEWLSNTGNPFVDFLGRWLHRFSTRPLAALDAFYSHTLYAAHLEARLQRYAERHNMKRSDVDVLDHPEIVREAGKLTEYTLLQAKSEKMAQLSKIFNDRVNIKKDADPATRAMLEIADILQFLVVPFRTVPLNAAKQGLDRTVMLPWHLAQLPIQGLRADRTAAQRTAENINARLPASERVLTADDILKRGREGYADELSKIREQQANRLSKVAIGGGLILLGLSEALAGHLHGDEPEDEAERRKWRANKWEPRTWNPGGMFERGFNYDNTFLAYPLAMAATAVERSDDEYKKLVQKGWTPSGATQNVARGVAATKGVTSAITHNFLLENLFDLVEGVRGNTSDPLAVGQKFLVDSAGRQIPNILTMAARLGDDFERETKAEGGLESALNQIVTQRIPGQRQKLEPKLGPLGQPVESRYKDDVSVVPGLPAIPGITSWPSQTKERFSSTAAILDKYDLSIPTPPETVTPRGGLPFQLTEQQKRIYLQAMGPELANRTVDVYNRFADPRFTNQQRSILGASQRHSTRFVERRALQRYAIGAAQAAGMKAVIDSLGTSDRERSKALQDLMLDQLTRANWEPDDED